MKIRALHQNTRRLAARIASMKSMLRHLTEKFALTETARDVIDVSGFMNIKIVIILYLYNTGGYRYFKFIDVKFIITVHFFILIIKSYILTLPFSFFIKHCK